jgi:hypothetical protein
VPVTAKLSKAFYERLGEQTANELVDWFNAQEAGHRAELRELHELGLARFDANLDQRLAALERRFDNRFADQRVELRELKAEMIKWIFLFWAGSAFAGLLIR